MDTPTRVELRIMAVQDAIRNLEYELGSEVKFHPGNNGDLGELWISDGRSEYVHVHAVRTERSY